MNEPKPLEKPRDIMSEALVKRLLSGKPTPLEREAAEAIMQAQTRADEWHKNFLEVSKHEQRARARCAEVEELFRDLIDANPRYNATTELAARIDAELGSSSSREVDG